MADRDSTTDSPTARTRSWLRRAGMVVGCLLAGAIINVLVAWGCALFIVGGATDANTTIVSGLSTFAGDSLQVTKIHFTERFGTDRVVGWYRSLAPIPGEPVNRLSGNDVDFVPRWGRSVIRRESMPDSSSEGMIITVAEARGWPAPALQWGFIVVYDGRADSVSTAHGIQIEDVILSNLGLDPGRPMALPYRPIWPGFLINTVFYGAIACMLFFTPRAARRHRRAKRRQCPTCGYPVGVSAVCTECGEPVKGVAT